MENASKALLIAGGILLLIILVSLMLFIKGNISDYYASEEELEMIADTAKFNEQFSRFNREDVQGYELISLINKVVDYNERLSIETQGGNDVQAKPITVTITLWNNSGSPTKSEVTRSFAHDNTLRLFTSSSVSQSNSINQLDNIFSIIKTIESKNKNIATLTKKISTLATKQTTNIGMINAINYYNSAIGSTVYEVPNDNEELSSVYEDMWKKLKEKNSEINNLTLIDQMCYYYEYTQFKKAYFKCTNLVYDTTTGKVTTLNFAFTGKIE